MDTLQILTPGNQKYAFPNSICSYEAFIALETGFRADSLFSFADQYLTDGMRVLDISENFDAFSIFMSAKIGPQGRISHFRQDNAHDHFLAENVRSNNITNLNLVDLRIDSATGNGFKSEYSLPPSLIRVSLSGSEDKIVQQIISEFEENTPLLLIKFRHHNIVNQPVLDLLRGFNFKIFRFIPSLSLLEETTDVNELDLSIDSIFACREEQVQALLGDRGLLFSPMVEMEDTHLSTIDTRSIPKFLFRYPYATEISDNWQENLATVQKPNLDEYFYALECFNRYCNTEISKSQRYAYLQRAYQAINKHADLGLTMSRIFSLSRIAYELGRISESIHFLSVVFDESRKNENTISIPEPFISPNPRFDYITPNGRLGDWLEASMIEQLVIADPMYSFYDPQNTLSRITTLATLGFFTNELAVRGLFANMRANGILELTPEIVHANDLLLYRLDDLRETVTIQTEEAVPV
ncbi:MAG: hypothetical protein OEX00_00050 [Gammaproteobacteria bacterium]|nr:hypothetical protein [Gammaproteobacteria bacterium]MDH5691579.1 hypothetical protein [Gammaproteobacteria bacterium]